MSKEWIGWAYLDQEGEVQIDVSRWDRRTRNAKSVLTGMLFDTEALAWEGVHTQLRELMEAHEIAFLAALKKAKTKWGEALAKEPLRST